MLHYTKRLYRRAKNYRENKDGAAAVEFAIVSIPFFMLIFGIVELALVFFINSTMTHAVGEAGRQIRTGNFQACGGADKFIEMVCESMDNIWNCTSNIEIDGITAPTFKAISMPDPDDKVDAGTYMPTNAGDPVVVRALFYYDLAMPSSFTRLETPGTPGVRVLVSSTAFRNEPFPAPGACPNP